MKVTVADGNNRISHDLPQAPEVGDSVTIKVPGVADRILTVRKRRWIFPVGDKPEVELDCS